MIPTADNDAVVSTLVPVTQEDLVLNKQFSSSVAGKLFNIVYTLKAFVKHDAWNEWGEGNCISLPIKIMQPPMVINCMTPQVQMPQGFAPVV